MSPITLWLFFTLDRIIYSFDILLGISIVWLIGVLIIWLIGMGCKYKEGYSGYETRQKNWSAYFSHLTKPFNILATVILCLSFSVCTFLPNTKEAVAIVVIPKVIKYASTNPDAVKIPDNVLKMANSFMEKKIADWAKEMKLDTISTISPVTPTPSVDSVITNLTQKLEAAKKLKEDVGKVLK